MNEFDWSAVYGRAWSAKAAMENEARRLEDAAARLRAAARELHQTLDPKSDKSEPK